VSHVISVPGYSIVKKGITSNGALSIVVLDHWDERQDPALFEGTVVHSVRPQLNALPFATVFPFRMPAIPGLGSTGGFEFILQSTSGDTPQGIPGTVYLIVNAIWIAE